MNAEAAPTIVTPGSNDMIALGEAAQWMRPAIWSDYVLGVALPNVDPPNRRAMPLGLRDAWVVAVREALFGPVWEARHDCAACGAVCEVSIEPWDLGLTGGVATTSDERLRPLTLGDLLAVDGLDDPTLKLIERIGCTDLSPEETSARLEALDPSADIWLRVPCTDCNSESRLAFDPVTWLMRECQWHAHGLLGEVAEIARDFHWSEAEILSLSDHRRAFYLQEVRA